MQNNSQKNILRFDELCNHIIGYCKNWTIEGDVHFTYKTCCLRYISLFTSLNICCIEIYYIWKEFWLVIILMMQHIDQNKFNILCNIKIFLYIQIWDNNH